VKAYQKFDPDKFPGLDGGQIKFSTYAVPMINGELRRNIRDLSHTVRRSRDGQGINNIDTLDRELRDDENSSQTIGDTVKDESCETDNQVIIKDFLSSINPRLQDTYRLWELGKSQSEIGKYFGLSQVQAGRMVSKLLDLAKQYGEKEDEDMGREMSPEAKLMRNKVDTFAKFGAIGTYDDVASKYGVGKGTAYAWMKKLQEEGKGKLAKLEATYEAITEVDEGEVLPLKTVPFTGTIEERVDDIFVNPLKVSGESQEGTSETLEVVGVDNPVQEDKVELEEAFKEPKRERSSLEWTEKEAKGDLDLELFDKVMSEIHQTDYPEQYETKKDDRGFHGCPVCNGQWAFERNALDCCKYKVNPEQTVDDLGGLTEPEPVWTSEYAEEQQSDRLAHKLDKSLKMSIAQMWTVLENDIETIRQVYIAQAEQEFSERLNQILGVTK